MKKTLVASILGIAVSAGSVVSSHAQGSIFFDNYADNGGAGAQITYGTGVTGETAGAGVTGFEAALYYSLTPVTDTAGNGAVNGGLTELANTGVNAGYITAVGTTPPGPGYFDGPIVTIPGYASGNVTFEMVAYNGSTYGGSTVRGTSGTWVEPSLATGQSPAGYFTAQPAFTVTTVPEPTTIALAGLGIAGMLVACRRK